MSTLAELVDHEAARHLLTTVSESYPDGRRTHAAQCSCGVRHVWKERDQVHARHVQLAIAEAAQTAALLRLTALPLSADRVGAVRGGDQ